MLKSWPSSYTMNTNNRMNLLAEMSKFLSTPQSVPERFAQDSLAVTVDTMEPESLQPTIAISQRVSEKDPALLHVCISALPPVLEKPMRGPADICCVIDVSGSMNAPASLADGEEAQLSVLDVVKHATNTILQSLNENDRLSVVIFSEKARTVSSNVKMNKSGKEATKKIIDKLDVEGRTNLWAGLLEGMSVLNAARKHSAKSNVVRNSAIFLLTDGIPNVDPPGEGYLNAMRKYKDEHGGFYPGTIHSFGFGYSLQSNVLLEIAEEGCGTYSFIPDSGFVGTAFVNSLANQLASFTARTIMSLQILDDNVTIVEKSCRPNGNFLITTWGVTFDVGNLHFGQQRDFFIQLNLGDKAKNLETASTTFVQATLEYQPLFTEVDGANIVEQSRITTSTEAQLNLEVNLLRTALIFDLTNQNFLIQPSASTAEVVLASSMRQWILSHQGKEAESFRLYVNGLLEDLEGQIRLAHSNDPYYHKWGRHYLPSLRRAHQLQMCNNFKDPGVQNYGGVLFEKLRDIAENIFLSLPGPKPARASLQRNSRVTAPTNMASYMNRSAGCFDGSGKVLLSDGSTKLVQDIVAGDMVSCDLSTYAAVVCVVKTRCSLSNTAELVEITNSKLLLTPYHPIWLDGKWHFPIELVGSTVTKQADYVYNFILGELYSKSKSNEKHFPRGQSMVVNGVKCITLAHGIEEDSVATHDFYGSEKVLKALSAYDGYTEGLVEMDEQDVKRSEDSGLVCGYK